MILSSLEHKPLTEPAFIKSFDFRFDSNASRNVDSVSSSLKLTQPGIAHAIVYWLIFYSLNKNNNTFKRVYAVFSKYPDNFNLHFIIINFFRFVLEYGWDINVSTLSNSFKQVSNNNNLFQYFLYERRISKMVVKCQSKYLWLSDKSPFTENKTKKKPKNILQIAQIINFPNTRLAFFA